MRVGIIGSGRMGSALATALREKGGFDVTVTDKEGHKTELLRSRGIAVSTNNSECVSQNDVAILAVKPADINSLLDEISGASEGKLIISIAAGIKLKLLQSKMPRAKIVRVMPNTPLMVGAGAAAYSLGKKAKEEDAKLVEQIFSSAGICLPVDEKLLDAVTGLSGCGPAFFYLFVDGMVEQAVELGLDRATALKLAAQTAIGAGKMLLEAELSPQDLIKMVASPGGATEEGLKVLDKKNLKKTIAKAVKAAAKKSKQLGKTN
ncbi:Pyrroline-5-carboxylate reductase [Candidatus Gugararchaeum adminiculabundum]|nr:Pyrroline-5-carboxylate reductase [Candidatus Gugararchaeum adminiculabundum]